MKKLLLILMLLMLAAPVYSAQTLEFEWDASTSTDVTGYNLYKSAATDGPWARLNSSLISGLTYSAEISDNIEATMYFYCTATDGINESAPSNIVSGRIDNIVPGAPGNLTITISIKIGE